MNLAFPALFVLLLLLPGILFSYSYRRGFFRRSPVTLGPIRNEVGQGIVWALFIHPLALGIVWICAGWAPKPGAFLSVFAGIGDVDPEVATDQFTAGLWYLIGTNLGMLLIGWAAHGFVRWRQLDIRLEGLRFNNEWHYLFSGEAWLFETEAVQEPAVSFVFISVVVDQGGDSVLYWGRLSDYFFDRSGRLKKIILTDAQRRLLEADTDRGEPISSPPDEADNPIDMPPESERFYPIRGEYFIIEYEHVRTLNVEYYQVLEAE